MDLKELQLVNPNSHWYYQSKAFALRRAVKKYCPDWKTLIDIGAGSGFFSCFLAQFETGHQVVCVDPNYEQEKNQHGGNLKFVRANPSVGADVYLFMDVLEHVEDDVALVKEYVQNAQPGAKVFITVPAFMSMWSAHDVYLEHFRRYRLQEIVKVVNNAGLTVIHQRYLFGSIFPIAWVVRRVKGTGTATSDLNTPNIVLNSLLRFVVKGEHLFWSNRLFGVSAFVVAEVPK